MDEHVNELRKISLWKQGEQATIKRRSTIL